MTQYYEDMDCEEAGKAIDELWAELGLEAVISEPVGAVEKQGDRDWPHVAYSVTVRAKNGRAHTFPWSMGTGLIKLPDRIPLHYRFDRAAPVEFERVFYALKRKPNANYKDKLLWAQTVAYVAKRTKQGPNPAEVFAQGCRDGLDARDESFENWAGNYGYDSDSRKAEAIFNTCRQLYAQVVELAGVENVERFAELANML